MHRPFFPFLFAIGAPLLLACGVGVSQSAPHPGPQPGPQPGPGLDGGSDASCPSNPLSDPMSCSTCDGTPVDIVCVNGSWTCPLYECPVQVPDAGCGATPVPSCPITTPCGPYYAVECVGNAWSCVEQFGGECLDAGPDAPDVVDASPAQPFACGDLGCDPTTTYCEITTGGPVVDGGGTGFMCALLPTGCSSGQATCACIGLIGNGCSCVEQHGNVTLTCELP